MIDVLPLNKRVMAQPFISYQGGKFYQIKGLLYRSGRRDPPKNYKWCIDGVDYIYIGSTSRVDTHYLGGCFFEERYRWAIYKKN